MKFSPQVGQQIINALKAKMPAEALGACSLCKTAAWELLDRFAVFTVSDEPQNIMLGGQILPCVVLVCTNCGNTHFLNINRLGLSHLLTPESEAKPIMPEVPQRPPSGLAPPIAVPKRPKT